ncbi:MAG: glycosyltransferase [Alphaproteobacteria bacterium]|nr:MAG: glycosyltransferase [Alphaproteobacteria bacterium]TAF15360.1 MAG: glycosyltransferase [Alphaproteobacteria bacterium]TAF39308.1 MAG: glycosyltransferase [Alphaproteobacteria bacterium]TAF75006.1 MAG: glycosyltransferase [Alphaproteobacteria bacterium]
MLRIINIMLSKGSGGIEQASLDYAMVLQDGQHDVLMITDPQADVNLRATRLGCGLTHLAQRSKWDVWASSRLRKIITGFQADIIITHGNRALNLVSRAHVPHVPIIAVSHNYSMNDLNKAQAVFAITEHMREEILKFHPRMHQKQCIYMPNMVAIQGLHARPRWHHPVRLGAIGRLVPKKGFDVWLHALALLRDQGYAFEAWLAGDGKEREPLEALCTSLGLDDCVIFKGWVSDNRDFYQSIDVCCVPSLHEPFGIVVIEAMAHGLPLIATDSEGPSEILSGFDCAKIVEKDNPEAMAQALIEVITHEAEAHDMGQRAHAHVAARFSMTQCAKRMNVALEEVLQMHLV